MWPPGWLLSLYSFQYSHYAFCPVQCDAIDGFFKTAHICMDASDFLSDDIGPDILDVRVIDFILTPSGIRCIVLQINDIVYFHLIDPLSLCAPFLIFSPGSRYWVVPVWPLPPKPAGVVTRRAAGSIQPSAGPSSTGGRIRIKPMAGRPKGRPESLVCHPPLFVGDSTSNRYNLPYYVVSFKRPPLFAPGGPGRWSAQKQFYTLLLAYAVPRVRGRSWVRRL